MFRIFTEWSQAPDLIRQILGREKGNISYDELSRRASDYVSTFGRMKDVEHQKLGDALAALIASGEVEVVTWGRGEPLTPLRLLFRLKRAAVFDTSGVIK